MVRRVPQRRAQLQRNDRRPELPHRLLQRA